jgi:hypothetical protein
MKSRLSARWGSTFLTRPSFENRLPEDSRPGRVRPCPLGQFSGSAGMARSGSFLAMAFCLSIIRFLSAPLQQKKRSGSGDQTGSHKHDHKQAVKFDRRCQFFCPPANGNLTDFDPGVGDLVSKDHDPHLFVAICRSDLNAIDRFNVVSPFGFSCKLIWGIGMGNNFVLMIQNGRVSDFRILHYLTNGHIQREDIGGQDRRTAFIGKPKGHIDTLVEKCLFGAVDFPLKDQKDDELKTTQTATPTAICRLIGDPVHEIPDPAVTELMVVVDNCFIHIMVVDAFSLAGMLYLLAVRLIPNQQATQSPDSFLMMSAHRWIICRRSHPKSSRREISRRLTPLASSNWAVSFFFAYRPDDRVPVQVGLKQK